VMRVGSVTERDRVNQIKVAIHYLRERFVRFSPSESLYQILIGHFAHSIIQCAPNPI
jgi:hypothetical protein